MADNNERVRPIHVFFLISLFLGGWVYTTVYEHMRRVEFINEVKLFMHAGARFTPADAAALEARIRALEESSDVDTEVQ